MAEETPDRPETRDGTDDDGRILPKRLHDWGHVYKTPIRTTTAVLLIAFFGCSTLYGYTSQRYGVVQPPPARVAPSSTTTSPPSFSSTPSSASLTTTATTNSTETGTEGDTQTGTDSGDTQTTTRSTVPGLPGV
ncbi:MAG: hypothetical protein SW127_07880, partial [Actinomycetota bacterium]|nr:hypothetical protein [Actinomycetota bacterium]